VWETVTYDAERFTFEKDPNNVSQAVKDMRVDYPVAIDNDHVIWRAFNNIEWPALYFVDARGRVRHHYPCEGAYGCRKTPPRTLVEHRNQRLKPLAYGRFVNHAKTI
jgi:hypothetical protein